MTEEKYAEMRQKTDDYQRLKLAMRVCAEEIQLLESHTHTDNWCVRTSRWGNSCEVPATHEEREAFRKVLIENRRAMIAASQKAMDQL